MKKRILNQEEPFTAPLSLPRIPVFTWKSHDIKLRATPDKLQKEQQSKITHLLLALQSGREITSKIFAHEISEYPPSFTRNGRMMVQMLRPGSATTFHEFFTLVIRPYTSSNGLITTIASTLYGTFIPRTAQNAVFVKTEAKGKE